MASALRIKAEDTDLFSPKAIKANNIIHRHSIGGPKNNGYDLKPSL